MKRIPDVSDRTFLRLLLCAAAFWAVLFQPRCEVGFFSDDAAFVLLAKRLWTVLFLPSGAVAGVDFSHFLPGYPAFLAPFTAAFEPRWALLRWTTAAVSLLSIYGWWRLLEGWLSSEERRWATLLYALHPLFLVSTGLVMADPFLAALFVFALLGLRRVLEGKGGPAYALLLGMTAWAALTKPIGILLAASLTAVLLSARAWKALRLMFLFIWLPCLAVGLASVIKSETPSDYIDYLVRGLAALNQQSLWERGYGLLHAFVLVYGLACPWPRGPLPDLFGAVFAAGVLYLCFRGFSALSDRQPHGRFVAMSAGLLVIGQGLVMALWTVYSERYALPLLPFGLLFLAAGIQSLAKDHPNSARGLLWAAALGFFIRTGLLAGETWSPRRPPETRLPLQTLAWIRAGTPAESRFIGLGPVLDLYAGRSGHGLFGAVNFDAFLSGLAGAGTTHAIVTEQTVFSTRGPYRNNQAWQRRMEKAWIRGHPGYFRKVYANPAESTEIYAVRLPARLAEARALYLQALPDMRGSDWPAAAAKLRRSLAETPDLPSVLVTLATVRLLQGKDAGEAEILLRRALALEPNYPQASLLLSGLLERGGRRSEAAKVRAEAGAALSLPPFEAVP